MNLWKESAVELVNFESYVSVKKTYYTYGKVHVYEKLHEGTWPIVEFEKENDDSELSVTMGQTGARKELDKDVCFGFNIVSGEACDEVGHENCFWYDENIKESTKNMLYENELTCFVSDLKAGKYRLICQIIKEGFSGNCQVRIHEEK